MEHLVINQPSSDVSVPIAEKVQEHCSSQFSISIHCDFTCLSKVNRNGTFIRTSTFEKDLVGSCWKTIRCQTLVERVQPGHYHYENYEYLLQNNQQVFNIPLVTSDCNPFLMNQQSFMHFPVASDVYGQNDFFDIGGQSRGTHHQSQMVGGYN